MDAAAGQARMGPEWLLLGRSLHLQILLWSVVVVFAMALLGVLVFVSACPSCGTSSFATPAKVFAAIVGYVLVHLLVVLVMRPRFRLQCRAWKADAEAALAIAPPDPFASPIRRIAPATHSTVHEVPTWERLLARSKMGTLFMVQIVMADGTFFIIQVNDFFATYSNALGWALLSTLGAIPLVFLFRRVRRLRRRAQDELRRFAQSQQPRSPTERPDFHPYWKRLGRTEPVPDQRS